MTLVVTNHRPRALGIMVNLSTTVASCTAFEGVTPCAHLGCEGVVAQTAATMTGGEALPSPSATAL